MEHRQWMYKGRPSHGKMTEEWKEKTEQFIDMAFDRDKRPYGTLCPCSECRNQKRQSKLIMGQHLVLYGFTPFYHTWKFHGEKPPKRAREVEAEQSTQSPGTGDLDTRIDECIDEYTSSFKSTHGEDKDPLKEPFDPLVAMLAGEGMRNGRLYIADGSVDTTSLPSLSKIRASRTCSNAGIEVRPKPSLVAFSDIQARLNEETRKREEAELREQQVHATLALQQQQMAQQQEMLARQQEFMAVMARQVQALSGSSGAPPLPPLPPVPTLSFGLVHPSAGSNNVPLDPSTNQHESPVTPATAS